TRTHHRLRTAAAHPGYRPVSGTHPNRCPAATASPDCHPAAVADSQPPSAAYAMTRSTLALTAISTAVLTFAAPAQLAGADVLLAPLTASPLASAAPAASCSGRAPTA